jgi:hypothetical protein
MNELVVKRPNPNAKRVAQLLWPDKDREVWFSLGENHEKACRFGLHQLRNCSTAAVLNFPICSSTSTPKLWTQHRPSGHAGIFGRDFWPSPGIA